MEFPNSNQRLEIADFFLEKVKKLQCTDDKLLEYFTEYLLILCYSIPDYLVFDFLSSISPKLSSVEISEINNKKYEIIKNPKRFPQISLEAKIFLKKYIQEKNSLLEKPLVQYFFTVRNKIFSGEFSKIYKILTIEGKPERRFQTNLVDFALINGDLDLLSKDKKNEHFVKSAENFLNNYSLIKNLTDKDKTELYVMLEEEDPVELLEFYLIEIYEFIKKFE